eukprot:gene31592-42130_t
MELDARDVVIVRLGEKHGVPTPAHRMLVALLRGACVIEGGAQDPFLTTFVPLGPSVAGHQLAFADFADICELHGRFSIVDACSRMIAAEIGQSTNADAASM